MQKEIINHYKNEIKEGLSALEEKHRMFFIRIYSHENRDKELSKVVDDLKEDQLDNALRLVNETLKKTSGFTKSL